MSVYRGTILLRLFIILFCCLWGGLLFWQIIRSDLANHSANPRAYAVYTAKRGSILERNGEILAYSEATERGYERRYLEPISTSHLIGYLHPRYGMTGLEKRYNSYLVQQRDIILTIDRTIQQVAEDRLDSPGAIVVLQPRTGQILAMVSKPYLNSNLLSELWLDYTSDVASPFFNRGTSGLYPPGSTLKPFLLAGAYEEGTTTPSAVIHDRGQITFDNQVIRNFGGIAHGSITVKQALALSSNQVFAQLAVSLGSTMLRYYHMFSMDSSWDLGVVNKSARMPSEHQSSFGWAQLGIGQGGMLVTPLQMAVAVSTIANRGVRMEPYLVREITGPWLMRRYQRPLVHSTVISSHTAAHVRDAMVLAVSQGTAQAARIPGLEVAGKTGTAQNQQGVDHSWFIGFAPADDPKVAIVVLVEHGGTGGLRAAPIGNTVIKTALESMEERLIP